MKKYKNFSCKNIIRNSMSEEEIRSSVIQVALELTTEQEPKWQYVASKLYVERLYDEVKINRNKKIEEIPYSNYYEFICEMTNKNLYGKYILENYTKEEIEELEKEIKPERDFIFTYSGINTTQFYMSSIDNPWYPILTFTFLYVRTRT